jgi:hypothetical protein
MANQRHVGLLEQGVNKWNVVQATEALIADISDARLEFRDLAGAQLTGANGMGAYLADVNLSGAHLDRAVLSEAVLFHANLERATLTQAALRKAQMGGANLRGAILREAILPWSDLTGADLRGADLSGADLSCAVLWGADLRGAFLRGANLTKAILVETTLQKADISGCNVYGVSAWNVALTGADQSGLRITPPKQSVIEVDNLEVAQFTYLLLNNSKIRSVIETVGKRAVLILGRFGERKVVLEGLRDALRAQGYLPIVFDFKRPTNRDLTESVMTLAGMCRFIVADITRPRVVPHELQALVPNFRVPFVPLIERGEEPFATFRDLWQRHREWVLQPLEYKDPEHLAKMVSRKIIGPANRRAVQLQRLKARRLRLRRTDAGAP